MRPKVLRPEVRRLPMAACGLLLLLWATSGISAQTLAHPGWVGSGMRAEVWWHNAVIYEAGPGSVASAGGPPEYGATDVPLLSLLRTMDGLQTLGIDALLLRGIEGVAKSGARLDPAFGTEEQFDTLLANASRRRMRVLVELHGDETGGALADDARFWLSRGVGGLLLPKPAGATEIGTLRAVLRGYVGERVLLSEASSPAAGNAPETPVPEVVGRDRGRRSPPARRSGAARAGVADMLLIALGGLDRDAATPADLQALRSSLARARSTPVEGAEPLIEVAGASPGRRSVAAEQGRASLLLNLRSSIALRGEGIFAATTPADAGRQTAPAGKALPDAATGSPEDPTMAWYRRILGIARGNSTVRTGTETVLDRDADGALVTVWSGSRETVVAITNMTDRPVHFSLVDDVAKLRLRGSFLRTLLRSDNGMGAMPLRAVVLPAYGVYIGVLGR